MADSNPTIVYTNNLDYPRNYTSPSLDKQVLRALEIQQIEPSIRPGLNNLFRKSEYDPELLKTSMDPLNRSLAHSNPASRGVSPSSKGPNEFSFTKNSAEKIDKEKELQLKLSLVLTQNEKLNQIVEKLSQEKTGNISKELNKDGIDWKERYSLLYHAMQEQKKQLAIEQDRFMSEIIHKERDLKFASDKIRDLQSENQRLRSTSRDSDDSRKSRYVDVNLNLIHQNETERKLLVAQNTDLQIRAINLAEDLSNVNKVLAEQEGQINFFKLELQKSKESEARLINELNDLKRNSEPLANKLRDLQVENEQQTIAYQDLRDQYSKLVVDVLNVKSVTPGFMNEEEAPKKEVQEKNEEELSECESNKHASLIIDDLNSKIACMATDNQKSTSALHEKIQENSLLKAQLEELNNKLAGQFNSENRSRPVTNEDSALLEDYKAQIDELVHENKTLKESISQIQEKLEEIKQRNASSHEDQSELVEQLNQRIKALAEELQIKDGENEIWRKKSEEHSGGSIEAQQLKAQVNMLIAENEALRRKTLDNEDNKLAVEQLNGKIEALNLELANKESELGLARQRQDENKAAEIAQLKSQVQQQHMEIEKLQSAMKQGENDFGEIQIRINELEIKAGSVNNLLNQIDLLEKELEAKSQEISSLKQTLEEMNGTITEFEPLKRQIIIFSSENEQLNETLSQKSNELDKATSRISELETILLKDKEMRTDYERLREENESLKACSKDVMGEINVLRKKILEDRFNEELILSRITERMNQTKSKRDLSPPQKSI